MRVMEQSITLELESGKLLEWYIGSHHKCRNYISKMNELIRLNST